MLGSEMNDILAFIASRKKLNKYTHKYTYKKHVKRCGTTNPIIQAYSSLYFC